LTLDGGLEALPRRVTIPYDAHGPARSEVGGNEEDDASDEGHGATGRSRRVIAIPALDLRGGASVRLAGGEYDREQLRLADPVGVARRWEQLGFRHLHIVDLDAAFGRGSNDRVVSDVLAASQAEVQIGGGIRSEDQIERLLDLGARRIVIGTRALEDMDWLDEMAARFPNELIVAADVRDRQVVTRAWVRTLPEDILDTVRDLNALPLAGVLVTAVHRQGLLRGTDLPLMEDVVEVSACPVYAAGGITTLNDLRALSDRGVMAAVIGLGLYAGTIDPRAAAAEFEE
jgi:phosphoribosylformimino-5-aminoimidazole carboxamide ribotide isomerase